MGVTPSAISPELGESVGVACTACVYTPVVIALLSYPTLTAIAFMVLAISMIRPEIYRRVELMTDVTGSVPSRV